MSISGASVIKESAHKIAFLKDQVVEMMCMMQQLIVGRGRDSYGPILEGPMPHSGNKAQLPLDPNEDKTTPPVGLQGVQRGGSF